MKKGEPFEVPMQGMGLFSFWREAFAPVNLPFLHFGAEEFYFAERTRQAGGKTICHPKIGWWHRFDWPKRTFPMGMKNKVRNYLIGWKSLYGSLDHPMMQEMIEHWKTILSEEDLVGSLQGALHPH